MKRILIAGLMLFPLAAQVRYEDILRGPGRNWLTYAGDYASTRHSPLKQIHRGNVASLAPKWIYHVEGARRLEVTPLVVNGVMYITNTNEIQALDARTGRRIWAYRAENVKGQRVNRGAAILGDRVFFATTDCHLLALNRLTGGLIWDREFASAEKGYTTTIAPLVVKDKVLVGVAGGGSGQRGFVAAIRAETGEEAWRFWTVPAPGEPGSETWGGFPHEWAGAPTWTTGSFDPGLNLVYWPTGNPWPDFYGGHRKGDNLYADSVVALDADTGKLKWYFQFTPHDTHDWDANETPVLIDAPFRGRVRKLLLQANRNGFYYILDRATGEFLLGKPFVEKLNWATGLDDKGRPIEAPNMDPTPGGVRVCPSVRGASNWMSPSYNPETGLFYVVTLEQCDIYYSSAKPGRPSTGFRGTGGEQIPAEPGQFYLRALDALTGQLHWEYKMTGPAVMWAGTVSTAGGIVFTGDDDGNLVALDSKTGEDLWHFPLGHKLFASPMTYEAESRQYVTIATETDIVTFGLHEPRPRPKETTHYGRPAVEIENNKLVLTVLADGGALARIVLKEDSEKINPLWDSLRDNPKASSIGHFVCVDGFGAVSESERAAGLPGHGEAHVLPWRTTHWDEAGPVKTLVQQVRLPLLQEVLVRTLRLTDEENVIRVHTKLENLLAFDRPVFWTEHATIGSPFLEPGVTVVDMSANRAMVRPYAGQSANLPRRLASGQEFTWPLAPLAAGGTVDLRATPESPNSTDITGHLVTGREYAFVTALHPKKHLLLGYVFKTSEYPWLQTWESYAPKGTLARGLEFGTVVFGRPRRDSLTQNRLFGQFLYRWLPARTTIESTYWVFWTHVPEGFRGVDEVAWTAGGLRIEDRHGGRTITLKASRE